MKFISKLHIFLLVIIIICLSIGVTGYHFYTKQALKSKSPQVYRPVIIGLDGLTFTNLVPLLKMGMAPNMAKLVEHGVYGELQAPLPILSAPTWVTAVTGVNPGKHGIFGFFRLEPQKDGSTIPYFVTSRQRRCKAFWEVMSELAPERKAGLFNIPLTNPAEELNGYVVSGWPFIRGGNVIYPPSLVDHLVGYRYEMKGEAFDLDNPDAYRNHILQTMEMRRKYAAKLFRDLPTDIFFSVFTGPDRIQHHFWYYYEPTRFELESENAVRWSRMIPYTYRLGDKIIGDYLGQCNENDVVITVSDHGFSAVHRRIWLSNILVNFYHEDQKTFSIFFVEGGVRINLKGREPHGIVPGKEYRAFLDELVNYFKSLKDEQTEEKLFQLVAPRDEVFKGKYKVDGPDIVLLPAKGYYLYEAHELGKGEVTDNLPLNIFTGFHRRQGVFLAAGPALVKTSQPLHGLELCDLTPNCLYMMGVKAPDYSDGVIWESLYKRSVVTNSPPSEAFASGILPDRALSKAEGEHAPEIKEQLTTLGYMR